MHSEHERPDVAGSKGVLIDVDGVLTTSWRPLPGALDGLRQLRSMGLPYALLTNTTTKTRVQLAQTLTSVGFEVGVDDVLTAPAAAAGYLRDAYPEARVFLLGPLHLADDLEGVELVTDDADLVLVAGADETFTHESLDRAFRMLMDGAPLVAMHRNMYWMTAAGLSLDSGAYIRGLEEAAGTTATVVGKPSARFFEQGVKKLGLEAPEVVMVGDDLRNDVLAAQEAGLRGVLVRTGKFREQDLAAVTARPWATVDSFREVPRLLRR